VTGKEVSPGALPLDPAKGAALRTPDLGFSEKRGQSSACNRLSRPLFSEEPRVLDSKASSKNPGFPRSSCHDFVSSKTFSKTVQSLIRLARFPCYGKGAVEVPAVCGPLGPRTGRQAGHADPSVLPAT
jgi:hypothetical protein